MFGMNSPPYSERARVHRVRLAHPDSQIQLSNSNINSSCRVARQPSIIRWNDLAVKPIRVAFFAVTESAEPTRFSLGRRRCTALGVARARTARCQMVVLTCQTRHSRRVLIVHGFRTAFNPRQPKTQWTSRDCHARHTAAVLRSATPAAMPRTANCSRVTRR